MEAGRLSRSRNSDHGDSARGRGDDSHRACAIFKVSVLRSSGPLSNCWQHRWDAENMKWCPLFALVDCRSNFSKDLKSRVNPPPTPCSILAHPFYSLQVDASSNFLAFNFPLRSAPVVQMGSACRVSVFTFLVEPLDWSTYLFFRKMCILSTSRL